MPPLDRYNDNNALEYLDEFKGVADNNTAVGVRVVVALEGKV